MCQENGIWLVISRKFEPNFCVLDFYFRIAQVEYRGQIGQEHKNSWPQTFDWYILISEKWELRTWNLGQIFRTNLNLFTVIFCSMEIHSETFSLHAFFAQCSSSRSSISKRENLFDSRTKSVIWWMTQYRKSSLKQPVAASCLRRKPLCWCSTP